MVIRTLIIHDFPHPGRQSRVFAPPSTLDVKRKKAPLHPPDRSIGDAEF